MATIVSTTASGLVFGACQEPTQVRLQLWTDIPCSEFEGVAITSEPSFPRAAQSIAAGARLARTRACGANGYIGDLFVYPENGTAEAAIVIRAGRAGVDPTLCKPPTYAGCVVAKRQIAFLPNRTLDLPVWLYRDCVDVPCEDGTSDTTTCVPGKKCVGALTLCSGPQLTCSLSTDLPAGSDAGRTKDAAVGVDARVPAPCENLKTPAICNGVTCGLGEHCCATSTTSFCTRDACAEGSMRACCTDPDTCAIDSTCIRASDEQDGLAQKCVTKPVPSAFKHACRVAGHCSAVTPFSGCKLDYGKGTIGVCAPTAASTTAFVPSPPPPPPPPWSAPKSPRIPR